MNKESKNPLGTFISNGPGGGVEMMGGKGVFKNLGRALAENKQYQDVIYGVGRGGLLEHRNGTATLSYADWEATGGNGGWKQFVQDVHGLTPDEFLSIPDGAKGQIYRGDIVGKEAIKGADIHFTAPKLEFSSENYKNGEYQGVIEGTPEQNIEQAAMSVASDDRGVSKLFDREVLNPLLAGAGGNNLIQSAKENALVRTARTAEDTHRTLSRRGTQLTPAQRMAINNQLGVSSANNATNTVNKASIAQQDTNNKELNSLFELTSRERFANSKTISQLAGVSAERSADNAAANSAYKNQRLQNTISGAMSGFSLASGG